MYVANRERGPLRVGGGDRVIGVQEGMGMVLNGEKSGG